MRNQTLKNVLWLLLGTGVLCTSAVLAQNVDPQNVLIRNVQLIQGGEGTEGVSVNILIKDNKLEIITKDVVTVDDSMLAVDARNGFQLGQLKIGETPSLIILNQDPRENFEILMDTSFFTVFAVHNGRLFENNLFEVEEEAAEEEPKRIGWTAYAPPPMALPLSYASSDSATTDRTPPSPIIRAIVTRRWIKSMARSRITESS